MTLLSLAVLTADAVGAGLLPIVLYVGPETALPIASGLAALLGILLMVWRYVLTAFGRAWRFVVRHVGRLTGGSPSDGQRKAA